VNFSSIGPHSAWLRMRGFASGQKVLRIGLDDGNPLSRATTTDGVWRWKLVTPQINVLSAGVHAIRILRKDPNVELDKIIITPGTYKPAGLGPVESPRN
jgi:glycosyl hydrolase family 115